MLDEGLKPGTLRGDLSYRIIKNYARLEEKEYRCETIFGAREDGWPGDKIGRVILALTLLWRVTGREPAYLRSLIGALDGVMPAHGYFGRKLQEGYADEQQLSGHNWMLRGLIEYVSLTGDKHAKEILHTIVRNLYRPLRGKNLYRNYPREREVRDMNGEAIGRLNDGMVNNWILSSDTGCAYMCLDGLSAYYSVYDDKDAGNLAEEMAETFLRIDFIASSLQTHASLTTARGIFRLYKKTGDRTKLDIVKNFFELYLEKGMTENYANYNWFGRPYWTEPCAIVDSYIIAVWLFSETGEARYADIAGRILYTGLGHAQRSNGGFGCDLCVTADEGGSLPLKAHKDNYEAWWCCTMRGAEGLTFAADSAVIKREKEVVFTNYVSGDYEYPDISFTLESGFPGEGAAEILITKCEGSFNLLFCLPYGILPEDVHLSTDSRESILSFSDGFWLARVEKPGKYVLSFPLMELRKPSVKHPGKTTFWRGWEMMGRRVNVGDNYIPINDTIYRSRDAMIHEETTIVF
jgi:hypothetical protein